MRRTNMKSTQQLKSMKNFTTINGYILVIFWIIGLIYGIGGLFNNQSSFWALVLIILALTLFTYLYIFTKDAIEDIIAMSKINIAQNNKIYNLEKQVEQLMKTMNQEPTEK